MQGEVRSHVYVERACHPMKMMPYGTRRYGVVDMLDAKAAPFFRGSKLSRNYLPFANLATAAVTMSTMSTIDLPRNATAGGRHS